MPTSRPVVLVTGASRGIGAATAILAGRRGYAVAVNFKEDHAGAQAVVAKIQESGGIAEAFAADVGDPKAVSGMFCELDSRLGRIAALVNNAGFAGGRIPFVDVTPNQIEAILRPTLFGTVYCIQEAVKQMSIRRRGRGGAIVNVGSESARHGGNLLAAYASAKAAVHTLTLGLARELAADGIRVNAVSPGVIATGAQDQQTSACESIPLGRMGTPEEVAEAILWLLSPEASYITGAVLPVNGGR